MPATPQSSASNAPAPLGGQVAVVTGASRGAGRAIAVVLGGAGATVYVTGRSRRAVAALATDAGVLQKSGRLLTAGELAREYGFTDADGRQPPPFRLPDEG